VAESLRLPRSKKSNRADYTTPLAALIRRMKVDESRNESISGAPPIDREHA